MRPFHVSTAVSVINDIDSLLHYRSTAFCDPDNRNNTITGVHPTRNPTDGQVPSLGDASRICSLYFENCKGVCGDGIIQADGGEECDDGNNIDGDGCSASCKREGCDTGIVESGLGEDCDLGLLNGKQSSECDTNCVLVSTCPLQTCDSTA